MTDEHLRHICLLSSITAGGLRTDRDEWIEFMRKADDRELQDQHTCLAIMADAFVELMNRAGMKPKLAMPAATRPHMHPVIQQ